MDVVILVVREVDLGNAIRVEEKAMATHSSTLGLENPMDGGAW